MISALYAQDELRIASRLTLNAGVRYDHYSTFGGTTNPRLALIYRPAGKTTLKLLYGDAFSAPDVYEITPDFGSFLRRQPETPAGAHSEFRGESATRTGTILSALQRCVSQPD